MLMPCANYECLDWTIFDASFLFAIEAGTHALVTTTYLLRKILRYTTSIIIAR